MNGDAPECAPPQAPLRRPRLTLPADSCDTHVHVIGPRSDYPLAAHRSYTPQVCTLAMYRSVMAHCGIARAVLVQPSVYGTDNRQLLDALREGGPAFRGVVVPRADADDAELEAMHALGVRGIRLNLVNPRAVTPEATIALCDRVAERGWHLQVQVRWSDAVEPLLADLAARTRLPLVIDHMGRPETMQVPALLALLSSGRGWVKLSAPYRLGPPAWPPGTGVLPLVRTLVATNPERLLWASDWPHTERFEPTPDDADLVDLLDAWLPDAGLRRRVCVDNPARLYDF